MRPIAQDWTLTRQTPATRRRDATFDIAKGLAMVAIVLGHVNRGLGAAGMVSTSSWWYEILDTGLYLVHLCVFAFVAGLFVERGVRRSRGEYLRARIGQAVYLYLLWSVLQRATGILAGGAANDAPVVSDLYRFWVPPGQLWFFGWLCIAAVAGAVLEPWRGRAHRGATVVVIALSCVVWGWNGHYVGTWGIALLAPYLVGVLLGVERVQRALSASVAWRCVATIGCALVFAALLPELPTPPRPGGPVHTHDLVSGVLGGILASAVGTAGIVIACAFVAEWRAFGWLAFVGKRSLEIFVAHITVTASVRSALRAVGVHNLPVHYVVATVAGVVAPLLLAALLEQLRLPFFFTAPPWVTNRRVRTTSRTRV
ncbi:MAG: acyltransferase [Nocardioides sp.]|uniref:acyltransferase family protein n=1 Tax=Nocardioides sp. TaxID=35761 RepID=UPI0039E3AD82